VEVDLLPSGFQAYAGYVDGHFQTYNKLKAKFPGAQLLSIAVFASSDADCLDIETGDATPEQAADWFVRQIKRGVHRPVLYANAFTMREVISVMNTAKVPRNSIRLWSAHYGNGEHICGPSSCGLITISADGTQWTDQFRGKSVDQSVLNYDFFGTVPTWEVRMMNTLPVLTLNANDANGGVWFVHRVQSVLNDIFGYKLTIDGDFGPKTQAGVKWLQGNYGITQTGNVDQAT